jgi:hypothetical protein
MYLVGEAQDRRELSRSLRELAALASLLGRLHP